ncbi:MAG: DUF721 domain-containing protein [Actinomycetes bacterium]
MTGPDPDVPAVSGAGAAPVPTEPSVVDHGGDLARAAFLAALAGTPGGGVVPPGRAGSGRAGSGRAGSGRAGSGRQGGRGRGDAQPVPERRGIRPLEHNRGGLSGPGPDERDPVPVGVVLVRLAPVQGGGPGVATGRLLGQWEQLVGPAVAEHCRPVEVIGTELVVAAESTAWATQLRLMGPVLLDRLSAQVGPGVVRTVRVLGPSGPRWTHGPRVVRGRGPRDTYG